LARIEEAFNSYAMVGKVLTIYSSRAAWEKQEDQKEKLS